MRIQFIGNRPVKQLAGVAAGILGLLTCIGVMASPASAATTTVVEHVCKVLGGDSYGNQAILCSDLLANDYGGGYTAQVRTEAYCQDLDADLVQCASITVSNETAYVGSGKTITSAVFANNCGRSAGNCPGTRFYATGFEVPTNLPACINNAWGVTLDSGPGTSIQLPESNKTYTLSANYATPHTSVGSC